MRPKNRRKLRKKRLKWARQGSWVRPPISLQTKLPKFKKVPIGNNPMPTKT